MPNGVDHLFCQWKAENLTKNSTKLDVLLTFLMWTIRLQSVFSLKTENNPKKKKEKGLFPPKILSHVVIHTQK